MTDKTPSPDLDALTLDELVELNERVQAKLNQKLAAEKAELERRQMALAKLTDRVQNKKAPKPAAAAPRRPAPAAVKPAAEERSQAAVAAPAEEGATAAE